jgi:hypothetical protein
LQRLMYANMHVIPYVCDCVLVCDGLHDWPL